MSFSSTRCSPQFIGPVDLTPRRPGLEAVEHRRLFSGSPALNISDVSLVEGNAGTRSATLVVSLNAPSTRTVSVNYGTANGTATNASMLPS